MADPLIDAAAPKDAPAPIATPPAPAPAPVVIQPAAPAAKVEPAPAAKVDTTAADLASIRAMAEEAQRIRDDLARSQQTDVNTRRLNKLREMGLVIDGRSLTEAEVLALAPKDDPHAAGSDAAFEAFRTARPGLFKSREPTLEQRVAGITLLKEPRFKDTPIMNFTQLTKTVIGGGGR